MAQLPLDISGRTGLSQYPSQSIRNTFDTPDGNALEGIYNPFIRTGYLSPANGAVSSVTLDNASNSVFKNSIYDAVNDDFYIGSDGALYIGDTTTDTALVRTFVPPNTNSSVLTDTEIYMINGARKMFVLYNNTNLGNVDISISDLPYNSGTDNPTWLTATATGGFTRAGYGNATDFFMRVSDNGYAYLFLKNSVSKLDGTTAGGANGTITPDVLLFPVNYSMVDSLDYSGKMFIAIHTFSNDTRSNNPSFFPSGPLSVGIYIWDRQSTIIGTADWIPLPGFVTINSIFLSPTGNIRVLATDSNGYTQLLQYNGSSFSVVFRLTYNAFPLYRDSIGVFGQCNVWWGKDGILYMFGPIKPGETEGLYKLYSVAVASTNGGVVLTSGSLTAAPAIYLTYQESGGTLVQSRLAISTLISQLSSATSLTGTVTFPVRYLPVYAKTSYIKVPCIPISSAGAATQIATIKVYLNQNNTPFITKSVYQLEANTGMIDIPCAKVGVWSVQVEVSWVNGLTLGANDFCCHTAYLEYEPIEKRK